MALSFEEAGVFCAQSQVVAEEMEDAGPVFMCLC